MRKKKKEKKKGRRGGLILSDFDEPAIGFPHPKLIAGRRGRRGRSRRGLERWWAGGRIGMMMDIGEGVETRMIKNWLPMTAAE